MALLLRMFRRTGQHERISTFATSPDPLSSTTLESRLTLFRRRRRLAVLKRVGTMAPVVIGTSALVLIAIGGIASFR
jgi:hypothetical protein